jgi:hypothetical protein
MGLLSAAPVAPDPVAYLDAAAATPAGVELVTLTLSAAMPEG